MNQPLAIRQAQASDLDAVAGIFTRAYATLSFLPKLHSAEEDRLFWRDRVMVRSSVYLAEMGDHPVGILALEQDHIGQLHVDPPMFGTGVGSALIRHAQGLRSDLRLWCFQDNHRARAFYERHGFRALELTEGAGNEEKMPDMLYGWSRT